MLLLIYLFGVIFYFFFPLWGWFPLLLFSLKVRKYVFPSLMLVSFSFALLAFCADSSGFISTDLIRYRDSYSTYVGNPFGFMFTMNILYDTLSWLFANYISDNSRCVGLLWVFISNLFMMLSVKNLSEYYVGSNYKLHFICYLAVILIIPLAMQNELLKQVTSFSLALYIISRIICNKRRSITVLLSFLCFFVHPSSSVFLVPLFFVKSDIIQNNMKLIVAFSIIVSQFNILNLMLYMPIPNGLNDLLDIQSIISDYAEFSSFGGSKRYYLVFFFYSLMLVNLLRYKIDNRCKTALVSLELMWSILLINISNVHNFARFTNTLYPFFVMSLIVSVYVMRSKGMLYYVFIVCSLVMSNIILYYSNKDVGYYLTYMNNDFVNLFSSSVIDYLDYR